jgi:ribosomal protein L15
MKEVSLEILKEKKLVNKKINKVKIYGDHKLSKALNVNGLSVTKGALKSIEESGGKVS